MTSLVHIIRPGMPPVEARLSRTPPRIQFLGVIYARIDDPETGESLDAYSPYPSDDTEYPQFKGDQ